MSPKVRKRFQTLGFGEQDRNRVRFWMHRCRLGQRLTRASRAASASLPHEQGVRTVRFIRVHMCDIHARIHLVPLIKVPAAMKPAMKRVVP